MDINGTEIDQRLRALDTACLCDANKALGLESVELRMRWLLTQVFIVNDTFDNLSFFGIMFHY